MFVKIVEYKKKDYFDLVDLNTAEYKLATNKSTTETMREFGGIEEDAPYGKKSTHPNSTETVYLGMLDKMPKYIQKKAQEFRVAQQMMNEEIEQKR